MQKLFIKLFATPNGKYFFEPNKNQFVKISEETFWSLHECLENGKDLAETDEICILKNQGFLAEESKVETVKHLVTDFLPVFLDRKITKVTLQLTQSCNFRCKYCVYSEDINTQQRAHSSKHMTWEIAKKALEFLHAHSVDSETVNVGFYGGEPLLEFKLIKRIVDYCKEIFVGKNLTYAITSNGTLLTEEMIHYFAENEFQLMISLDGPKEINDANRVFIDGRGTYDEVMKKLALIAEIEPDYMEKVSFSMVMDPKNDFDCINSVYVDAGAMNKWNISASLVDKDYDMEATEFSESYTYKYEYGRFLALLAYFKRIDKELVPPISYQTVMTTIKDVSRFESTAGLLPVDAPSGPCVPGQLRLLVNAEGKFYPCERVSESSAAMCIGNLDDGFDIEKIAKLLNVGALTTEQCKNCWAFRFCDMCAKKADDNGAQLSAKKKLLFCNETRSGAYSRLLNILLFKEMLELYPEQIKIVE